MGDWWCSVRHRVDACGRCDRRCSSFGLRGAIAALVFVIALPAQAQVVPPAGYAGRPLAAVLQALQARGLRIIFSSNLVTSEMRVRMEPRALDPRRQLDELLAPHGLMAREGPGRTLQIVRAPVASELNSALVPPGKQEEETKVPEPLRTYYERITVMSSPPWWHPSGVSEEIAHRGDLTSMPGGLVDDPLQAIHSMPRVAPLGDYRSEFVVRASPFRHAEVVVDGVSTSWLRHAPDPSASVSMFTSQVLDSATLRAGAYPRTYGDRLGPQLELTLREGSRERAQLHGTVANTAATIVAEGPIGQARGSWIAAARQSFLEWPGEHLGTTRPVFGFSDAMAKLVFDVGTRHQLGFTLITGKSRVDGEEDIEVAPPTEATARTSVVNMAWRSTVGSTTVITHRAYLVRQESAPSLGADQEVVYRPTLVTETPTGLLEIGAQVGRAEWSRDGHSPAASWTRSGHVHLRSQVAPRLTISPGIRVSDASHIAGPAVTPWLIAELGVRRSWTIAASTGLSHQFPEVGRVHGVPSLDRVRPESATHVDVSIRHQLTPNVQWQTTLYHRRERGVLDGPQPPDQRLAGSARGLEVVIERRAVNGLSGWGAYSYGRARQIDARRGEAFWADFDQRHAITAFGSYRWPDSTSLGATLRLGSGIPIPGYLSSHDESLFIGQRRNDVRLSTYARLDVRAARAFQLRDRRIHAFVEAVNLLNRSNMGPAVGAFLPGGEAVGFIERLTPRRASVGVTIGF
jgi:hypothetical protein